MPGHCGILAAPFARRHHRVVCINIDPSALGRPVAHKLAMQADAALALDDLLAALDGATLQVEASWLGRLRATRASDAAALAQMAQDDQPVMHPAALAQAIGRTIDQSLDRLLPPDALIVFDGGHTSFWSNDFIPVSDVRTRFHDPSMSHLGFGLPYELALKACHPDRPVLNITGDGAFGFTVAELDSARRHRLAVITLIHNNASRGIIRAGQKAQFDFEFGSGLEDTDYAAIARGFGCHGETVTRTEEVAPAIGRALASGLPAVIDCRTRFVAHPTMPVFGAMNRYDHDALVRLKKP